MKKITPFLWFESQAEEAMNFYVSVFPNSKIVSIARYGDAMPAMKGKVLTGVFELNGEQLMALDGGPQFKFTGAISFFVNCETQEEVDNLWERLSEGGRKDRCGWLTDKYGVFWQIVPTVLGKLASDPDPVKSQRVIQAMLKMTKLDIAKLEAAYKGE